MAGAPLPSAPLPKFCDRSGWGAGLARHFRACAYGVSQGGASTKFLVVGLANVRSGQTPLPLTAIELPQHCTDMDEPVKTVAAFIPWAPLLSGYGGRALVLEARRLSTVNHSDIRGLLPGGEQSTHDCDSSGAASI